MSTQEVAGPTRSTGICSASWVISWRTYIEPTNILRHEQWLEYIIWLWMFRIIWHAFVFVSIDLNVVVLLVVVVGHCPLVNPPSSAPKYDCAAATLRKAPAAPEPPGGAWRLVNWQCWPALFWWINGHYRCLNWRYRPKLEVPTIHKASIWASWNSHWMNVYRTKWLRCLGMGQLIMV